MEVNSMNDLLRIDGISKKYGDKTVVAKESFCVKQGDILGLIGPNGAGKSTSINMISTLLLPESGKIFFHGQDITSRQIEYKKSLGIVPQDLAIYEDLSAYDNVKFFCSLYYIRGKELKKKVEEALTFVGLWDKRKELPSKFSGGMKRRLNIACGIAHGPELLIMDEPTVGIDPQSRNHILQTVKTLNSHGTTIIYTSHYMEEIDALCNRILLMDNGQILEDSDKQSYKDKYAKKGCQTLEDIFLYATGTDLRDMEE